MTKKDLLRMDLVQQAASGTFTGPQVAQALGISVRQVRRLISAFRMKGAEGLIHGNRGKVSPARLPDPIREDVLRLLRTEFADYSTAQARDDLRDLYGIPLSYSTLYRLRKSAGLASPRRHRIAAHRTRRQRAAQEGLLLQADGSSHAWLEDRGPRLTLIAYVDDATGRIVGATFRDQEDLVGYLSVLKNICASHGVPHTLYTDRHTLFGAPPEPTLAQELRGEPARSHTQRVLEDLGVTRIAAHSPQAKGRVERLFGTLQDRLTHELRRAHASTRADANQVLADYLPRFNARFAHAARNPSPAYRPWPAGLLPEQIFSLHYERTVANDNTIAFAGLHLPIRPSPGRRHYARAKVQLLFQLDGRLDVYYHHDLIATYAHAPDVPVRANRFVPATPVQHSPTDLHAPPHPRPCHAEEVRTSAVSHP